MASASSPSANTVDDGTKDYTPLRSTRYDLRKPHIADTPMTWRNWYQHINWLNTALIVIIPFTGLIYSYWVPIYTPTAIFSVIYYFNTGLGITAGS
jgi:stearoyl-CoA desaturase (delta-9 desaturase)